MTSTQKVYDQADLEGGHEAPDNIANPSVRQKYLLQEHEAEACPKHLDG